MRPLKVPVQATLALSMLLAADTARGVTEESLKDASIAITSVTAEKLGLSLSVTADELVDRLTFTTS